MNQPSTSTNRRRGGAADPEETKELLLDAALRCLAEHGYAGTSARVVAGEAGVNPGLISYHFGGMRPMLVAAMRRSNDRRLLRYAEATADVGSIGELIAAWERLHTEDVEVGHIGAMVAMLGATSAVPELRGEMAAIFEPWVQFAKDRVDDALAGSPLGSLVPTEQAGFVILSLFVGMELLTNLDGYGERADELFAVGKGLANFIPSGMFNLGGDR
jgi:AcrR family transcriptional regulator